jgi:hypothetical protein
MGPFLPNHMLPEAGDFFTRTTGTDDLLGECLEDPGEILLNGSDEQKQAMSG